MRLTVDDLTEGEPVRDREFLEWFVERAEGCRLLINPDDDERQRQGRSDQLAKALQPLLQAPKG